jgi:hypothetical protein
MINMISSAFKAAYVETFYPAMGNQAACSGAGVVSLHLLPPAPSAGGLVQRELLVLTRDSLEQWKVRPLLSQLIPDISNLPSCTGSIRA